MADKSKTSKLSSQAKVKLSQMWVKKNGTATFTQHGDTSNKNSEE